MLPAHLCFVPTGSPSGPSFGRTTVENGRVHLLHGTLLEDNSAPAGHGASVYLSLAGSLEYTLPAPSAHYVFVRQGKAELEPGAREDLAFPYKCPAGVVGGSLAGEQTGPGCKEPW